MFEKLLRRNRSVDIDRLIFDIAQYKRTEDYEAEGFRTESNQPTA